MITIVTESGNYDLHNDYNFSGYYLSGAVNKVLKIHFEKVIGSWVKDSDPQKISIVFHGISYLKVNLSFYDEAFDSDKTLSDLNGISEIAFKPPNDFDMDWFVENSESTEENHIVFFIDSDNYIRAYAEEISITLD